MNKEIGLVMEGGGFRGAYTAGALSWLIEQGIYFDYSASISAAAIYAFYYAAKMPEQLYDFSVNAITDRKCIGLYSILHEGQIVGYEYMLEKYALPTYRKALENIRNSDLNLEIGLFNMNREKLEYYDVNDFDDNCQLLKASCVLPFYGKMTEVNGQKYLDGGIDTMISVKRARETGHKKCFVIVTKDKNYVRKPYGWLVNTLLKLFYGKYKNMLKILDHRVEAYYDQMNAVYEMENEGTAMLIRPSRDCGVGRFSGTREQIDSMYKLGYQDMEDRKEEILRFINS